MDKSPSRNTPSLLSRFDDIISTLIYLLEVNEDIRKIVNPAGMAPHSVCREDVGVDQHLPQLYSAKDLARTMKRHREEMDDFIMRVEAFQLELEEIGQSGRPKDDLYPRHLEKRFWSHDPTVTLKFKALWLKSSLSYLVGEHNLSMENHEEDTLLALHSEDDA